MHFNSACDHVTTSYFVSHLQLKPLATIGCTAVATEQMTPQQSSQTFTTLMDVNNHTCIKHQPSNSHQTAKTAEKRFENGWTIDFSTIF